MKHYKKNQTKYKIISLFMAFLLIGLPLFSYSGSSNRVYAEDKSLEDLQKESKELSQKIKDAEKNLAASQKKAKDAAAKAAELSNQIQIVQGQVADYLSKIDNVNKQIELKTAEIDAKTLEVQLNEQLFAQRVRVMYINNSSSTTMSTLLGSKSFADFLNKTEFLRRISEEDNRLINNLKEEKAALDKAKKELEENQAELTSTKNQLSSKQSSLDKLLDNTEAEKNQSLQDEKKYIEMRDKYKKEQDKLDAEINKMLAELENNAAYGDGILKWPLPGYTRFSSNFGWRVLWGKNDYHPALDIPAPAGTSILAADNGKVLKAAFSSSYGNHVVIDHGNGLATLYAHASALNVSAGQVVTKGQVIAKVGTTGNSTGNHLHFEVRVTKNGVTTQVNPLGYVNPK